MKKSIIAISIAGIVAVIALISFYNKTPPTNDVTLRIATNPWPGYEYLHLAEEKGFLKAEGANIQLLRFLSMEDARRAFELGKVDAFAGTLIELLQVNEYDAPGKVIMISDYSAGPDIIVARNAIKNVTDLKGKKIGVEQATLSIFVVARMLEQAGLSLDDVKIIGINQKDMEEELLAGMVDAVHTYPPASFAILQHKDKIHKIFDSSAIPEEIVGVTIINPASVNRNKENILALKRAWDKAKDYAEKNPEQANKIMAEVENITPAEFAESLKGINVLSVTKQQELMNSPKFAETIKKVADVLHKIGELNQEIKNPESFIEK